MKISTPLRNRKPLVRCILTPFYFIFYKLNENLYENFHIIPFYIVFHWTSILMCKTLASMFMNFCWKNLLFHVISTCNFFHMRSPFDRIKIALGISLQALRWLNTLVQMKTFFFVWLWRSSWIKSPHEKKHFRPPNVWSTICNYL